MTFAVGIFDLFTYAIPGSLYLGFFSYVAFRLHWLSPGAVGGVPTALLVVIVVLASYLLGHVGYPVGSWLNRVLPRRRRRDAQEEFLRRVPEALGRDYLRVHSHLLLGALQLHDKDVAVEVSRLRAVGLMLRNSAPPMVLSFLVAAVEVFTSDRPLLAVAVAVVSAGITLALVAQGRRLGHWAHLKTLELCFWLPDLDDKVVKPAAP